LNDAIRDEIAEIDCGVGPIRARVAQAAEKIVRILMPRASDEATGRRRAIDHDERSWLVTYALMAGAPVCTVHDAQAVVMAEFARSLLETDFRRERMDDAGRPFGYLVQCVRNRAVELWRTEMGIERRHENAANDAALATGVDMNAIDDDANEKEEIAEKLAELGERVPLALQALDKDELLLLVFSTVLRHDRNRIGGILGTTANAVGARLRRLRDRLHLLVREGRTRAPERGRSRSGKASAQKRAEARRASTSSDASDNDNDDNDDDDDSA
jgi:DNA-directed RNA polymerase specialized sigma24 family protein